MIPKGQSPRKCQKMHPYKINNIKHKEQKFPKRLKQKMLMITSIKKLAQYKFRTLNLPFKINKKQVSSLSKKNL
jgi:hypothetical protein